MSRGQYTTWDDMEKGKGEDIAYEDECPGNVVFFYMEVMDEEDENARDDNGGEQLAQT